MCPCSMRQLHMHVTCLLSYSARLFSASPLAVKTRGGHTCCICGGVAAGRLCTAARGREQSGRSGYNLVANAGRLRWVQQRGALQVAHLPAALRRVKG